MEYDPTNRGMLFKRNESSENNEPDYTGTINIEGKKYFFEGRFIDSVGNGKEVIALEVTHEYILPRQSGTYVSAAKFEHEHGRPITQDDLKPDEYSYTYEDGKTLILMGEDLRIIEREL